MDKEYNAIVQACADQGQKLAQSMAIGGIFEPLYLYHLPSGPGKTGMLVLVRDSEPAPEGACLTTGEGLRGNVPYHNYFQWIWERARRAPVLSY